LNSLFERLQAHGLDAIQAEIWSKFIHAIVDAIRVAEANLCELEAWSKYCQMAGAFRRARKTKKNVLPRLPAEEGLTDAIVQQLQSHRAAVPEGHFLREWEVHFEPEGHVRSERRIGKRSRRCDIRARSYRLVRAPDLIFEAKVVDSDSDIAKRYLGPDGLGCFTNPPDPYTQEPIGGLIAYTVSSDPAHWLSRIRSAFSSAPSRLLSLSTVKVGVRLEEILVAEVERTKLGLASILIINLVLTFETDPPRVAA
jgi:hypothetical protein